MVKCFFLFIFICLTGFGPANATEYRSNENTAVFSGRISRLNRVAKLVRVKIDFKNAKFLKKKDRIEFWNETYPEKKCMSYLEGSTSEYLLLRVPEYNICIRSVHVSTGTYLHLYSPDLDNSLGIAKDLVSILLKKRLALNSRLTNFRKMVDGYVEKMDVVNKRYEILRQKMEIEWQQELSALEEDKTKNYLNFKHTQSRLNELDYKLQKYRVQDQNLQEDRWSLDPKLYYKK